jgi:quinol monooxygenase YgiN
MQAKAMPPGEAYSIRLSSEDPTQHYIKENFGASDSHSSHMSTAHTQNTIKWK